MSSVCARNSLELLHCIPVILILLSYGSISSFLSHSTLARGKPSVIQDSLIVSPEEYVVLCSNRYEINGSTI